MILFLVICLVVGAGTYVGGAHAALINGSDADDYLVGTPNNDTINGKAGRDEIHGLAGSDLLDGGPGRDLIEGNGGADFMIGGGGNDVLYAWGGTSGKDYISCGTGEDWAYIGPLDTAKPSCEHVEVLP